MSKTISNETYDDFCKTLTDFENSSDDNMSDGEWLDVLYEMCVKLQNEMNK